MNEHAETGFANEDLIPLRNDEFAYIANLVYGRFGIHLPDQKRVLVSGRLSKRLRQLGCATFGDYIALLNADGSGSELSEMMNRLTTNHSFFFRESSHFDFLTGTVLPELEKERASRGGNQGLANYPLRIWSAGCASGEEVYSLGMLLHDRYALAVGGPDLGLLATDISLTALSTAKQGVYGEQKFTETPEAFRKRYLRSAGAGEWAVAEEIKNMVLFKRLNLMAENYPMKGQFDVILCRNVMIYFDQESRSRVTQNLYRYVKEGGYLFIGHSESLNRDTNPFEYVKPAVYRKLSRATRISGGTA